MSRVFGAGRVFGAICGIWLAAFGYADAASLLPNGKQQFVDGNGVPFAEGTVEFFFPNTSSQKTTWQDQNQTILNTNPVVLDADGRGVVYGEGTYRQILRDKQGNLIWDQLTADPAVFNSTWGETSTGTANNQIVPNGNFSALDGQVYSFKAGFTNTAGLTITVTGIGSYQARKDTESGPVALTGGEVTAGNVVNMVYDAGLGVFHLVAFPPDSQGSFAVLTVTGQTTIAGPLALSSTITPSITANQNDWAPAGIAGALRVFANPSGNFIITGIGGTHVNGQTLYITNVSSTNPITLVGENSSSIATNRLTLGAPISLSANQTTQLIYDSVSSRWKQGVPTVAGSLGGSYRGLGVVVTNDTTVNITANTLLLNSAVGAAVRRAGFSETCVITTSGLNGLDSGSESSSTWYAVYAVYNPSTNVNGCLLSTSDTTPVLPAGFTFFNRFGWVRNNGSSNLYRTIQKGTKASYVVGSNPTASLTMISGASGNPDTPIWTGVPVGNFVPSTASEIVVNLIGASTTGQYTIAAPNNSYGAGNNPSDPPPMSRVEAGGSGTAGYDNTIGNFVLESTNVYYAADASTSSLRCLGWVDNL